VVSGDRSTMDVLFVARLLQEKYQEQHRSLLFAFIDLTKAFDTVNRDLLWKVLSKYGCPLHFLTILREFHDGMKAMVDWWPRIRPVRSSRWRPAMVCFGTGHF